MCVHISYAHREDIKLKEGYSSKNFSEDLLLFYDRFYKDNLSLDYIDIENVLNEKNAVILSRLYMLSQLTIDEFVRSSIYVRRSEFDKMWKFYKKVALKHDLRPIVMNGNLIFNKSFSKDMMNIDGIFVLGR